MDDVLQSATDVRITDYAEPVFSPDIRALMDSVAPIAAELRLEPDAVLAEATAQSSLDDFGDPSFRERLAVLLHGLRYEAGLSQFGVLSNHTLVVQLLKNRLLIQDLLQRHPEIRDEPIERPIIICGLPRTGTSHLHNLISADGSLRSLPYWESLEPFPAPDEVADPDGVDPRLVRCRQGYERADRMLPHLRAMHHMTPEHVHEEIEVQELDFGTYNLEWYARVPRWRDFYLSCDLRPSYAYLRRALQALTWLRGPQRWVLKSPQHLSQFPVLLKTFPDATFVITHRDPVSVTVSMATMAAYTARLQLASIDPVRIGAYWSERVEDLLRDCTADRAILPADQSLDVRFADFMSDEWGTIERIYGTAGQPLTADGRRSMKDFIRTHPRDRHGRIAYDTTVLGIDADERRTALSAYIDAFVSFGHD